MVFLRKTRLRIAGVLAGKDFGKIPGKPPSKSKRAISRMVPRSRILAERIRPLGRRLPTGYKRIPKTWLQPEAQDAIERISFSLRIGTKSGLAIAAASIITQIMTANRNEFRPLLLTIPAVAGLYMTAHGMKAVERDLQWLQQYLRKQISSSQIQKLLESKKYHFFVIKNGELALTTADEFYAREFSERKQVTVIDIQTNRIVYQGPERRQRERRKKDQRNPNHRIVDTN